MNATKFNNDINKELQLLECLDWLQDTKDCVEIPNLQVLDPSIEKTDEELHQTDQILKAFSPDK